MLAYKSGNAGAFSTLVERHRHTVFNFILRSVHQRQRAEDLLQETWLRVVRGSSEWQPRARFLTWVFTLARNLCVDNARKESFRSTRSLDAPLGDDTERTLGDMVGDENTAAPDRAADNVRVRPKIERALQRLSPDVREVFLLREYQGLMFKEIGEIVGASENTAKSRMRYALEFLRKYLEEDGVEPDADPTQSERAVASR